MSARAHLVRRTNQESAGIERWHRPEYSTRSYGLFCACSERTGLRETMQGRRRRRAVGKYVLAHVEGHQQLIKSEETIMIKLKINGKEQDWDGDPALSLLWFLRDEIGLTGAKFGCGQALCGACTVMWTGRPCGPASRRCRMWPDGRSRRSKVCIRPAIMRCRRPGVRSTYRNAASVSPARSCRPRHCCRKSEADPRPDPRGHGGQHLPLRLLSADRNRGASRFDGGLIMNIIANPSKLQSKAASGSRMSPAAAFSRASASPAGWCSPRRSCRARRWRPITTGAGQDAARHGGRPARLRRHRIRRNGDHRGASFRNGHRHPHQPSDGRRRRDGSRLVAG